MAKIAWYEDQKELGFFADALNNAEEFKDDEGDDDNDQLVYYIQKPWEWTTEHDQWEEFGSPSDDTEKGWQDFLAFLEKR